MPTKKTYRYPGTQPFTAEQQHLFYGRKQELEDLLKLIRFQQTVVLHGKSGLGKSSLLNAAIAPGVKGLRIAEPFFVRFNAWTDDQEAADTPLEKTFRVLMPESGGELAPLAGDGPSLWLAAKARQLLTLNKKSAASGGILLIFDQFEELFTYPEEQVLAFKADFAEMLRASLPRRFEQSVGSLKLSEDALESLYEPANVRALIAIRSDRMHLLDKLSDLLPNILRHSYELLALTPGDARSAIEEPAHAEGDFISPAFRYEPKALEQILRFLRDEDGRVEAIQLQTLCQAFERKVMVNSQAPDHLITTSDTQEQGLKAIIEDYYLTQLADPGIAGEYDTARRLIEDELVIETEGGKGVRVTMHELSLLAKFSDRNRDEAAEKARLRRLLDALVNLHVLRREVGSRGGDTYELAHDRLIAPVLAGKKERLAQEAEAERQRKEAETQRQLAQERRKRQQARRVALGLGALSVLSLLALAGAWWQNDIAVKAKTDAEQKRSEAETATQTALGEKHRADSLAMQAQNSAEEANKQRNAAVAALNKADAERRQRVAVEVKKFMDGARRMQQIGDLEVAESMLREALKLDPGNEEVIRALKRLKG